MGSARLPGKVLRPLAGTPLLELLLARLQRCSTLDGIVVATTDAVADDAVAAHCANRGLPCARGPVDDVAQRLLEAAEAAGFDALARVNGDSPLLDPALVDRGVRLLTAEVDLVTNVFPPPRTFPPGQSVEVVRTGVLRAALPLMTEAGDREHVTPVFYRHGDRYRIRGFRSDRDYAGLRLVVDTLDDAERIEGLLRRLERPQWEYGLDELAEVAA